MNSNAPIVLFALDPSMKTGFLPGYDAAKLPPHREEWLDFTTLNPESWEKLLRTLRPEVLVTGWRSPGIPQSLVHDEALSVKYVCHVTGGVKGIVSRDIISRGIIVSNWGSTISHTIAEHAMLLILGALRNVPLWRPNMTEPSFEAKIPITTRSLRGRKIGIHGFGAIVRELISFLKPFGVSISSYSAGVPAELFKQQGVHRCESLEDLASNCEIFVELEALTPQSTGTVNAHVLSLLPHGAVFVNVGRGAVVDEVALGDLATKGKINVALDVYAHEPLPQDSPLFKVPNALLSPHIAGPTQDGLLLCGEFALSNLRRYLSGHPEQIEGKVTVEIYDRTT